MLCVFNSYTRQKKEKLDVGLIFKADKETIYEDKELPKEERNDRNKKLQNTGTTPRIQDGLLTSEENNKC